MHPAGKNPEAGVLERPCRTIGLADPARLENRRSGLGTDVVFKSNQVLNKSAGSKRKQWTACSTGEGCSITNLHDETSYGADSFDVTMQPVAPSGGCHPGRRPGHDDIPRGQFEVSGQIGYDLGNLPDHLTEIALLTGFAIHLEPDGTCLRMTDFTRSDER